MAKFKIPRVECESGRSRGRSNSKRNAGQYGRIPHDEGRGREGAQISVNIRVGRESMREEDKWHNLRSRRLNARVVDPAADPIQREMQASTAASLAPGAEVPNAHKYR